MPSEHSINTLLTAFELEQKTLQNALDHLSERTIDYGDVYLQHIMEESWSLEDSVVKDGSFHIDHGIGVRACIGEKTGFSYTDSFNADDLWQASQAASCIAKQGKSQCIPLKAKDNTQTLYADTNPLESLSKKQKVALLQEMDSLARQIDPRVKQVFASLSGCYERVLVAATDGTFAADVRPLVRLNCSVIVEENGRRERGTSGGGGRDSYALFFEMQGEHTRAHSYVQEAVRQALVNLKAIDAPAGNMPVILGAGWPGVLLHEAVGHGLEADFNRKGTSIFSGRIGQQVASTLCTIVDNGTMQGRRGSLSIDDEGTPAKNNILIENGILCGYMQDKMNARLMGLEPTGNGRRESYSCLPMPRMTNTYMLAGKQTLDDMLAGVKRGLYAPGFSGGQVDITSGNFVFSASEAYLIENGKLTAPVKGATLTGNGPESMQKISMVGQDLALDQGVGVCGKAGQSVPVGVGQPTLKLDEMIVGGTQ